MTRPAARVGDMHVCPMVTGVIPHVGGPVVVPVPTVMIGKMPAATATALAVCVGPPHPVVMGSAKVLVGKKPQARLGDACAYGGALVAGCFTVMVGG
ncbi:PAAR domain-containing protein [uncultured Albimonas sp.]|uniref:PAAR domain-containing protein n=1 Tax=uncultured Albimonas sp. TaxID=1331701 RepID=UPI0030EBBC44|tara:strand:- start:342 stop:632 length:291 start_codon:yes stop_codon:yes gene_type:complete